MKKTLLGIVLLCAFSFVLLTGCGKKGLVGKWEYETGGYVYTFNEDGTGSYAISGFESKFTYTTEGNKISILYEGNTAAFESEFEIDGDTLNVKDSLGNDTIYKRK